MVRGPMLHITQPHPPLPDPPPRKGGREPETSDICFCCDPAVHGCIMKEKRTTEGPRYVPSPLAGEGQGEGDTCVSSVRSDPEQKQHAQHAP